MLNSVSLQGRLTADPELKHTQSGISVVSFNIACERSFANKDGKRTADFITINAWRQTAEFVCKHFSKGDMIVLDGSIETRRYEDKNGNKRTAFEVKANNVHFSGAKATKEPTEQYSAGSNDDFNVIDDSEDLPF